VIFVDSNIPMYLVGAPHPHKADAQRLLEQCITRREKLVTDAEVFQEILHRYAGISWRDALQPCFDALLGVVDEIFPVNLAVVERAKQIVLGREGLSARDALHVAVMQEHSVEQILSFDVRFDRVPGVKRLQT